MNIQNNDICRQSFSRNKNYFNVLSLPELQLFQNINMNTSEQSSAQIFISYSHKDRKWLDRLNVHLAPIKRLYSMIIWDDTTIKPGMKWDEEIKEALSSIQVAVLLISADFLASEYIYNEELPVILEAASKKGATILSIIISPSIFNIVPGLAEIQCVNNPGDPLINMSDKKKEGLFVKVAEQIIALLNKQPAKTPPGVEGKNIASYSNNQSSFEQIKKQIQIFVDTGKADRFLIISVGDVYIQFDYRPATFEIKFETTSNEFLPKEHKLSLGQTEQLLSLGFHKPGENPNFHIDSGFDSRKNVQKIAEITSDILFKVHRLPLSSKISFEQSDF